MQKQIRQLTHLHKFAFIMMRARGNNIILLIVKRNVTCKSGYLYTRMQIKAAYSAPCRVRRGFE